MTSFMHTAEQLSAALAGRYVVEHQTGEGGMAQLRTTLLLDWQSLFAAPAAARAP